MVVSASSLIAAAAAAYASPVELAPIDTAFLACTSWMGQPDMRGDASAFAESTGLERNGLIAIADVPEFALPPPPARVDMHHWQVLNGSGAFLITAAETSPICHIVGGGAADLFAAINAFAAKPSFKAVWREGDRRTSGDMVTRTFSLVADDRVQMTMSHAAEAGARLDRPQLVASVFYGEGD